MQFAHAERLSKSADIIPPTRRIANETTIASSRHGITSSEQKPGMSLQG